MTFEKPCTLHTWQFTYNYGTFIGAATALYQATGNSSYLSDAQAAANVSLTNVTTNGILNDEGTGDGGGFKGIYVRYLAQFAQIANQSQFIAFLQKNATVAWSNRRRGDNLIGTNWAAEAPSGTIDAHTYGSQGLKIIAGEPSNGRAGQEPEQDHGKELGVWRQSARFLSDGSK